MTESVEIVMKQDFEKTLAYKHEVDLLIWNSVAANKVEGYSPIFNSDRIFLGDRKYVGPVMRGLGKSRYKVTAYFFVGSTIDQLVYTYFPHHSPKLKALKFPEVRNCTWWQSILNPKRVLSYGQNWKSITEVAEIMFKEFINWFPKEELDDFEHAIFKDEDVDSRLAETFLKVKRALIN